MFTPTALLVTTLEIAVQVLVFVGFVALSALLAACETALASAPSYYRDRLSATTEDPQGALGPPEPAFTAVLAGKHLASVAAGGLAVALTRTVLAAAWWIAVIVGILGAWLILLSVGEIAPRTSAARDPEAGGMDLTPWIRVTHIVLAPVVAVIQALSRGRGTDPVPSRMFLDEEEIQRVVEAGREQGVIEEEEQEMIEAVIEFGADQVGDVMAPRTDVVAIEASSPIEEAAALVSQTGFSRIPVYREDLDNIVGVVYSKDILDAVREDAKQATDSVMNETMFVPETTSLDEILREMKTRRIHMAIVHDEFGGTAGLVTLEDLLEEIVGDIFDEYDPEAQDVSWVEENEAIIDARMDIDRVNEELGISLPAQQGYETLGGFLFHKLGRPGRAGESLEEDDITFVLEEVANRRILTVRVQVPEKEEDGENDEEEA